MVSGLRRKLYIAQLDAGRDSIFILVGFVHLVVVHPLELVVQFFIDTQFHIYVYRPDI